MSTIFSDSFTRANSGTIDATNWIEIATGNWDLVSNAVTSASAGQLITTTSAHAAIADCKATAKCVSAPAGFDGGLMVRATTDGLNCYFLDAIRSAGTLSVFRKVANVDTQLGADITGLTIANGDTYTLEVSGTGATVTLKAYQNGVQRGSNFTDSSGSRITSAGQTGIIEFTGASVTWDDFLAENLVAGGRILRPSDGIGSGGSQTMSGGMRAQSEQRSRIFVPSNYRARIPSRVLRPELRA
jgi:hypothetical protein